jgi:hypothetical protein
MAGLLEFFIPGDLGASAKTVSTASRLIVHECHGFRSTAVIFNLSDSEKVNRVRDGIVDHVNTGNAPPGVAGLLYVEEPIECPHKLQITTIGLFQPDRSVKPADIW